MNYFIPIVFSILYFLTVKQVIPNVVYLILGVLAGLYYFPIRMALLLRKSLDSNIRSRVAVFTSNFLFAILLSLSVLNLYLEDGKVLSNIIGIFAIVNFLAMVYYLTIEKNSYSFIIHFCFLIFISAVMFV